MTIYGYFKIRQKMASINYHSLAVPSRQLGGNNKYSMEDSSFLTLGTQLKKLHNQEPN